MVSRRLQTLIVLVLAAWCSIVPVMVHGCPCCPEHSEFAWNATTSPDAPRDAVLESSCCGCCCPTDSTVGADSDGSEGQPWDCHCDTSSHVLFYLTKVSTQDRISDRSLQSDILLSYQPTATIDGKRVDWDFSASLPFDHQRKLATIGVWRL